MEKHPYAVKSSSHSQTLALWNQGSPRWATGVRVNMTSLERLSSGWDGLAAGA